MRLDSRYIVLMEKNICSSCVSEKYLSNEIQHEGRQGLCSYCGEEDVPTLSVNQIAQAVEFVFQHSFELTANCPSSLDYTLMGDDELDYEWEREGESPIDIVVEVTEVAYDVAKDIVDLMDARNQIDERRDPGGEAPFSNDARYEARGYNSHSLDSDWEKMRQGLHHNARFFNQGLREFLDDLFSDIHGRNGRSGTAIRTVEPGSKFGTSIFRARVAATAEGINEILIGSPTALGAPTGRKVRPGRMNAAGISVFYGACDRDTCLAEVRAPVGSDVVVGRFDLIRQVKLLDLEALERVFVKRSPFDPGYVKDLKKCKFLNTLSDRFSMPVMPGGEEFDYLLTQAVCEYLAGSVEPRLDGVIFRSSQRGGKGKNLTLFNHASFVEAHTYPTGTKVRSWFNSGGEDDDDSYTVSIEKPDETIPQAKDCDPHGDYNYDSLSTIDSTARLLPTLRLRLDEIEVIKIKGVSYSKRTVTVHRHEYTGPLEF